MPQCPPSKILLKRQHRRNLPGPASRKRTEGNFVLAFERVYLAKLKSSVNFLKVREVPVSGFGVADFVWAMWKNEMTQGAVAIEGRDLIPPEQPFIRAFEMKLQDWSGGLAQAARYRFFAHQAFLVVPVDQAMLAQKKRATFDAAGVGLISFDLKTGTLRTVIRAEKGLPLSVRAHRCVLTKLSSIKPTRAVLEGTLLTR